MPSFNNINMLSIFVLYTVVTDTVVNLYEIHYNQHIFKGAIIF